MTTNTETKKSINKLAIAKKITKTVVTKSASATVVTLIHQNTKTFSGAQKFQLYVGAFVVGSMVADKAWDHTEQQIDEIIDTVRSLRKKDEPVKDEDVAVITDAE